MTQKRAAIYIRVASQSQLEESVNKQKVACEAYAKSIQMEVINLYNYVGSSAPLNQRPELQKLLSDAKNGLFDVIIVQRADRISRSILDVAIFKQRLNDIGVELVITEQMKHSSPEETIANSFLKAIIGP
ncbi:MULTISPECIES: recombinase family protein [Paenibacillus]|uniref:recombinase family protein n=1 Tax=Paenibacillus TaxID=44249 RepID=UPI0010B29D24|nr:MULTISPECIES: recombinase family protein [Paenibacillus]GCL74837.1 hypothetical protein PN4B1_48190 [Paenibacillus naphthalenovorans]